MRHVVLLILGAGFVLTGCGDGAGVDGHRLWAAVLWLGDHPALTGLGVAIMTPFIAMIPVVGAPLAAVWAKVGTAVIPALKQIAEAVEADEQERTLRESAAVVVGKLADRTDVAVGRVPGLEAVAKAGAIGMIARIRARRARRRAG